MKNLLALTVLLTVSNILTAQCMPNPGLAGEEQYGLFHESPGDSSTANSLPHVYLGEDYEMTFTFLLPEILISDVESGPGIDVAPKLPLTEAEFTEIDQVALPEGLQLESENVDWLFPAADDNPYCFQIKGIVTDAAELGLHEFQIKLLVVSPALNNIPYPLIFEFTISVLEAASPIADFGKEALSLYPNPSSGTINIHGEKGLNLRRDQIAIYDYLGHELPYKLQQDFDGIYIDLLDKLPGLYWIKIGPETKSFLVR